ncbi:MAG: peptidoglycan DD-metalloendopeptidase family protein [Shimia sp.]
MAFPQRFPRYVSALAAVGALAACDTSNLDLDIRDRLGGPDTSAAARAVVGPRPEPDARGVISYPNYQVAVARRGDTLATMAGRLGFSAEELARYNGVSADTPLRQGEIMALPARIEAAAPQAPDITDLASGAIERATPDPIRTTPIASTTLPAANSGGAGPVRHKVERGETAFSIARLYNVPVRALGEWNGLGPELSVREGQFLLIPVAGATPPRDVTSPGSGSVTPTPPSSTRAQPDPTDEAPATLPPAGATSVAAAPRTPAPAPAAPAAPPPDLGEQTAAPGGGEFRFPVQGPIIRAYARGRNEGIDIGAPAGATVRAAQDGTVAAITRDTNNVAIVVVRHDANLLTVYTNVDNVAVSDGARVSQGQKIAEVKAGDPSFLHFEIRDGLESVNPLTYLTQ